VAQFLPLEAGFLVPHAWGVAYFDPGDLSTRTVVEGFEDVVQLQVQGDTLYLAGTRDGVASLWTAPVGGGEPLSVGLDGSELRWFQVYRGVLYVRVVVDREASEMRRIDLETGDATPLLAPATSITFYGSDGLVPYTDTLWRMPLDTIAEGDGSALATMDAPIQGIYPGEDEIHFLSGARQSRELAQHDLWRLDPATWESVHIAKLPWSLETVSFEPNGGDLLFSTLPDFDLAHTFWTIPLEGGELTKVTELDAFTSSVNQRTGASALTATHAYHAEDATDVATAILQVERP